MPKRRTNYLGRPLPDHVIRRLVVYRDAAHALLSRGEHFASSAEIARIALGIANGADPGQMFRKDMQILARSMGNTGSIPGLAERGVGTKLNMLATVVEHALPTRTPVPAVVLGAGNFGKAIASYPGFLERGTEIVGIFDVDKQKIGSHVGTLVVRHDDELPEFCEENGVKIAVVAVASKLDSIMNPKSTIRAVRLLVQSGVTGILQLSPGVVEVPPSVGLRRIDVTNTLAELIFSQNRPPTNLSR